MGEDKFVYKYVYPEDLRDLYVNGTIGGLTPRGELYMHLFSERHAFPKKMVCPIKDNKPDMSEAKVETGGNVVRLIQATIVMDINTAIAIRDWIDARIKEFSRWGKEESHVGGQE